MNENPLFCDRRFVTSFNYTRRNASKSVLSRTLTKLRDLSRVSFFSTGRSQFEYVHTSILYKVEAWCPGYMHGGLRNAHDQGDLSKFPQRQHWLSVRGHRDGYLNEAKPSSTSGGILLYITCSVAESSSDCCATLTRSSRFSSRRLVTWSACCLILNNIEARCSGGPAELRGSILALSSESFLIVV